jgi:hypothetical protein
MKDIKIKDFIEAMDNCVIIRMDREEIWTIKDGQFSVTNDADVILDSYNSFVSLEE